MMAASELCSSTVLYTAMQVRCGAAQCRCCGPFQGCGRQSWRDVNYIVQGPSVRKRLELVNKLLVEDLESTMSLSGSWPSSTALVLSARLNNGTSELEPRLEPSAAR